MTDSQKIIAALDERILRKREQIARETENLITDLRGLVARAGSDTAPVPSCPIQAQATWINTYCGELNALIESREIAGA